MKKRSLRPLRPKVESSCLINILEEKRGEAAKKSEEVVNKPEENKKKLEETVGVKGEAKTEAKGKEEKVSPELEREKDQVAETAKGDAEELNKEKQVCLHWFSS